MRIYRKAKRPRNRAMRVKINANHIAFKSLERKSAEIQKRT